MQSIDAAHYRQTLGHFPTGVTVVAGIDPETDAAAGLAIGSFFSISIDPPLVGFCVGKSSGSWPRVSASGSFCVNVLAADQEDVCRVFASSGDDKFATIGWDAAGSGSPRIHDVLAWIDCDVETVHEAGDHDIIVGAVRDLGVEREVDPLVFFRGGYANLR